MSGQGAVGGTEHWRTVDVGIFGVWEPRVQQAPLLHIVLRVDHPPDVLHDRCLLTIAAHLQLKEWEAIEIDRTSYRIYFAMENVAYDNVSYPG